MPTIISILAVLVAAVAVFTALQMARRERARSAARVAVLADAIDPPAGDDFDLFPAEGDHPAATTPPSVGKEPGASVGLGVRSVGLGAGVVTAALLLVMGAASVTTALLSRPPAPVVSARNATSLTLLSMRHARQGETLTVTGLVRNDANRRTDPLVAVVFAFDKAGDFVASARAPIDTNALSPGDESPFRVAVPDVPDVARFRVSFRTEAGPVPHLDRRSSGGPRNAGGLPSRVAS